MLKTSNRLISTTLILSAIAATLFTIDCKKKQNILIDGSSTVYPITEGIAEEYRKVAPDTNVSIGVSGTGGGFKKFCNKETDISDASRTIKSSEAETCKNAGVEYLEVQIGFDGIAVIVNKETPFLSQLTVAQLKKIFDSEAPAKTWKEIDPAFPDQKIQVYAPGQDSGTYDYFVEEILGKKHQIRTDAVFSEDDNVLVTGIAGSKGSIGFFGLAYYEENKDKLKLIPIINPASGRAVSPDLETVKSGAYAPLSRPIFVYVNKAAKAREEVGKFLEFYMDNGARISKEVGYIPLEDKIYETNKEKIHNF